MAAHYGNGKSMKKPAALNLSEADVALACVITLSKGYITIVDVEDYPKLAELKWSASVHKNGRVYAVRQANGKRVYMHRKIMGDPAGDVDHRDPYRTLDNRRSNLRISSRTQNNANGRKRFGTSSRFKGVFLHRNTNKWAAQICINRKKKHLGLFVTEEAAAAAYRRSAGEVFGEFARP